MDTQIKPFGVFKLPYFILYTTNYYEVWSDNNTWNSAISHIITNKISNKKVYLPYIMSYRINRNYNFFQSKSFIIDITYLAIF